MIIKLSELKGLAERAIQRYGYNDKEMGIILDILMYAQLRGNNQGVVKLVGNGIAKREGALPPKIVKETPVSALVDGNKTYSMIVMDYVADLAIKKACESGIGIAGNFNTDESTGALGYYVKKVADRGLIGLAMSSAAFQTTAPYGSNQARFCTNPIAYGIPSDSEPIIFDMTTSAMAYYGLIEAKIAGKQVSEGIGFDANGNETTDPAKIMEGALKPLAGHRGSGLALLVQILSGLFVGGDSFNNESTNAGNLVIAIDPKIFVNTDEFKKNVSIMIRKIKDSRKIDDVQEIFVPGERGSRLTKQRLESGEIEVEDNLLSKLKEITSK